MDDIDDNQPPDYMPGGADDTGVRYVQTVNITGKGTFNGLVTIIERKLMEGQGVRFATDSFDVINQLCSVADRMGGTVEINFNAEFTPEGILILPAPEPSTVRH
jgi:hypothetical protein